jgi:hypothetical protein
MSTGKEVLGNTPSAVVEVNTKKGVRHAPPLSPTSQARCVPAQMLFSLN